MQKEASHTKGFSLLEVLLSTAIFSVFVGTFTLTLILGQETAAVAGERSRAVELATEGLEAVRNLRDASPVSPFTNLTIGTYGLELSGGVWALSGAFDQTEIFTREVEIAAVNDNTRQVTSTVTWDQTQQRTDEVVSVSTYLTDWSAANSEGPMRVTEYYLASGSFSGANYDLTLGQDLADDYFVIVQGSDGNGSSGSNRGPDENYISLTADPSGTGDLGTSTNSDVISFTRGNSVSSWVGVVTVVECLEDCDTNGFQLLDVKRVVHSGGDTSGSDTTSSWIDIDQVMLMGGFNGAGCDTATPSQVRNKVCHVRIYPTGSNAIDWTRHAGGASLATATSTVMVLEWGSDWDVQRVQVTGTAGGNGANGVGEYNTSTINSVARDNTWVWGTGYTEDNGIGDAAEGSLITLGDGVSQNSDETSVAVGQEYGDNKDFEVYALTHSDLAVDYVFKPDGQSGNLTYDVTVGSADDPTARMALIYNGQNGTGTAYPRPMFSARYADETTITLERRRSGQSWPAWIQGIDFSGLNP